jgi:serine/threonine protein phosphatase PrpC
MDLKTSPENLVDLFEKSKLCQSLDMASPEIFHSPIGEVAFFLRKGRKKQENEDSLLITTVGDHTLLLAVADGVGGHANGADASKIATDTLSEIVHHRSKDEPKIRNLVLDAFEEINEKIVSNFDEAATTLIVAEISNQAVRFYLAGDSVALIASARGRLKYRIYGHNPVDYGILAGIWDDSNYDPMNTRHIVLSVLGSEDMQVITSSSLTLSLHDTLVIGSDGLFDNLPPREIAKILGGKDILQISTQLKDRVISRMESNDKEYSKEDDLSFIIFRPKKPFQLSDVEDILSSQASEEK